MSVFNKIKNVLFTEEEETTEIPLIQKEEPKKEEPDVRRFDNFDFENKVQEIEKEEIKKEEVKEEIHKEEKSPFQVFDEEEFDRIAAINKNKLIERDRKLREEKERSQRYNAPQRIEIKEEKKEEVKRFKPTPVISPVYGILDKNYSKDDILPTASSEGTLPKIMDVDAVRQKAFGTLESIEKNLKEDDLDNIKITSFNDEDNDSSVVIPYVEEIDEDDEIEKTTPLPELEDIVDEIENEEPKVTREEIKRDKLDDDLFDLIDSMYKEEED